MTSSDEPGAGAQTGPAVRKAAPAGSGATIVELPVVGSRTPTPLVEMKAIRPPVAPPVIGEGLVPDTGPPPPPQAATSASVASAVDKRDARGRVRSRILM